MRSRRAAAVLPPVALLALTVVFCGGSFAEAATATVILHQQQERAQLGRDEEGVAALFSRLEGAARDLQKKPHGQAVLVRDRRPAQAPPARHRLTPPPDHRAAYETSLTLTLIDLPPPAASL